jgi:DNA-binding NarL/FixJ family response regulator
VTIRILLGTHHVGIRRSLRAFLEERPDWQIVAETDDDMNAVRLADDLQPDVAIIDIGTPSNDGMETTRRIVRQSPQTHILVLGTYPDDAYVRRVRQAGARGYLLTDDVDAYLQHAVTALSQGKYFFHNREVTEGV